MLVGTSGLSRVRRLWKLLMAVSLVGAAAIHAREAGAAPRTISGTPVGNSAIGEVVVFEMDYQTTGSIDEISAYSLWIDSQLPSGVRLHSSVHGRLERASISPPTFRLRGERYVGPAENCAAPKDALYCYKNYAWTVPPAENDTTRVTTIDGDRPSPTGYIYMNHDLGRVDTASPTDSTIARVRALSMTRISDNLMRIAWEVRFDAYFVDRELDIYQHMGKPDGSSYFTRPNWREVGAWTVGEPGAGQALVAEDRFDVFPQGTYNLSPNASGAAQSAQVYLGARALSVRDGKVEKVLAAPTAGIFRARFYDDLSATPVGVGLSATPGADPPDLWIGVANNGPRYLVRSRLENASGNELPLSQSAPQLLDTGVVRTAGWREVTFYVTAVGSWVEIRDTQRGIDSVSAAQLPAAKFGDTRVVPIHIGLRAAQVVQFGPLFAQDAGSQPQYYDELSVLTLPHVPTLAEMTTPAGALRWNDRWAAIYLDHYEEVLSGDHIRWIAESKDTRQKSAWNAAMHVLTLALGTRYRATGLPMYRSELNRVLRASLNPNVGTHLLTSFNLLETDVRDAIIVKALDAADRDHVNEQNPLPPEGSFYVPRADPQRGIGNAMIGDSHAENYSSFGPQVNALAAAFFTWHPRYFDLATRVARKTISTSTSDRYLAWPNETLKVKNVYAPDDPTPDCPADVDPTGSQGCFCKGDRAQMAPGWNLGYLIDNHDFSPHPGYAQAAALGPLSAITLLKLAGRSVPADMYGELRLARVIDRTYDFIDYQRHQFKNTNRIYRVRSKALCAVDPPKARPSTNPFQTLGLDDWGQLPDVNPGFFAAVELAFRNTADCAAIGHPLGCHVEGDLDLYTQTSRLFRYVHHNFIGQSEEPNVFFVPDDFTATDVTTARIVTASLRNSLVRAINRIGFYDLTPFASSRVGALVSSAAVTSTSAGDGRALVDGNLTNMWNSQMMAEQWVELKLPTEVPLLLVKLHVEQTPNGETRHEISLGREATGYGAQPDRVVVRETWDNDVINLYFSPPIQADRVLVRTKTSPSSVAWREIEVFRAP